MFFLPLRIDVMVGLVPVGETIPDERPQHTVLLVEAVEERTDMTMPTENIAADPGLVRRGLHIHTLTKRGPRYGRRTGLAPPGSIPLFNLGACGR
jgi:hypothetical protein